MGHDLLRLGRRLGVQLLGPLAEKLGSIQGLLLVRSLLIDAVTEGQHFEFSCGAGGAAISDLLPSTIPTGPIAHQG